MAGARFVVELLARAGGFTFDPGSRAPTRPGRPALPGYPVTVRSGGEQFAEMGRVLEKTG
jgi:hypothetical protein